LKKLALDFLNDGTVLFVCSTSEHIRPPWRLSSQRLTRPANMLQLILPFSVTASSRAMPPVSICCSLAVRCNPSPVRMWIMRCANVKCARPRVAGGFRHLLESLMLACGDAPADLRRDSAGAVAGNFPKLHLRHFD